MRTKQIAKEIEGKISIDAYFIDDGKEMKMKHKNGMSQKISELNNKLHGFDFTWGPIVKLHEIGEYKIVEYHPMIFKEGTFGTGIYEKKKVEFHTYINDRDTNRGYDTLDEALIGVIALKYDGLNTRADGYFIKMINITKEK